MSRSVAIMMALLVCGVTTAATITVAADGSGDYTTIQAAVNAATDGDEILVAPGTYTSSDYYVVNMKGKPITIRATGTPEETILDGEDARHVVRCVNGEGPDTIIEGFTITGGSGHYDGGCISCDSSSPTITGCTITGGSAYDGGGIYCWGSSPTITDCTISDNTAGSGGGIYCTSSSDPTITDCTISDNTANYGGGIDCWGSSPTITGCTISDNTAISGGGISVASTPIPSLTDTVVCGNNLDQIYPVDGWTDNGSNTVSDECPICSDTNSDALVDRNDVLAVVAAWGSDDPDADVDSDGLVGVFDLITVLASWGHCL